MGRQRFRKRTKYVASLLPNALQRTKCKQLYYLFILLLFVSISPNFSLAEEKNSWDERDKELFATFGTLMAVDMLQTRYIYKNEDYRETNPLIENYFRDEKVYGYFALTTLGTYLIANSLQPEHRKSFLRYLCMMQINVTNQNASIGIGFSF